MSKRIKWLLIGSLIFVSGIIILLIILYLYTPFINRAVVLAINSLSNQKFKISYLKLSGNLSKQIIIEDILVTFDDDSILCKRIEFDYSVFKLAEKKFHFNDVSVFQPTLILNNNDNNKKLSDSSSQTPPALSIPFQKFPDLIFKKLTLKEGSIILKDNNKINKFDDIQLSASGSINEDSLNFTFDNMGAYWENRKLLVSNLSFHMSGDPQKVILEKLELNDKHLEILANGEYQLPPNAQISLNINNIVVNLDLVNILIPDFPYKKGLTKISGSLRGMPQNFTGEIFSSGTFDSLQINHLQTHLHRRGNSLRLTDINVNSNFGGLTGSIFAALQGKNNAQLSITDVNLKKLGILAKETSVSGKVNFNFENWDLARLTGNGEVLLPSIKIGGILIDTLQLDVIGDNGNFTLREPSRVVIAKNSQFFLTGNFSKDQKIEIQLLTKDNQLDSLFDQIDMPEFRGRGELRLHLVGPVDNPDLDGHIKLDSLSYKNIKVYDVQGGIAIQNIVKDRVGNFNLDISSGQMNRLRLTKGSLKFSIKKNIVHIDTISFISDQNNIFIQGRLAIFPDSINTEFTALKLKYQDYLIQNSQGILIKVKNDTLHIKNFELTASNYGLIKIDGMWAFSQSTANGKLQIINTRLEPFNQFFNWNYQFKGVLSADFDFSGSIYNPLLTSTFNVNNAYLNDNPIGAISSKITYQDQKLTIEKFNYSFQDSSFINLNGFMQLSESDTLLKNILSPLNKLDFNIEISKIKIQNYAFLFDVNFPLEGVLSGKIEAKGTMSAPQVAINVTGKKAIIKDYRFKQFRIGSRILQSKILIDKAKINFLDTDFEVSGYKNIQWDFNNLDNLFKDKSFELMCKIKDDSLNFIYAFIPDVDRIIGNINLSARFGGYIDNPQLITGNVEIKNGDLYLTKIENPIQNVQLNAHVENKRLYIDQFQGRSPEVGIHENIFKKLLRRFFTPVRKLISPEQGKGDIKVAGYVDFSKLDNPKFNVDVSLKEAYFNYFLENTRVVVTSDNIEISGRDTISVSGTALVKRGIVELDFEESEKNLLLSKSTRQTPPYIQYLLNVQIPDNFFVRSNAAFNTFDVELSGNVRILQDPMELLEMYGELNIIKGKYFIQFEDFDIKSGSINFVNPKEYPELNLTAQKQKFNYLFDLTVSGPINNPVKEMHTKNLETNDEIYEIKDQMALLFFGVRFQELSGLGQSAFLHKGEDVLAQTLINQFETEARHFTGLDRIRITTQETDQNYGGITENNTDQVSTLALGKYITPNLYLEYQTKLAYVPGLASFPAPSLSWESGNQIYLKYRMSKNWSLSSFYQKTLRGNDKVQFDVNWQFDF